MIHLGRVGQVHYLDKSIIDGFCSVTLVSSTGCCFHTNHLLLACQSPLFCQLFKSYQELDELVVTTEFSDQDLVLLNRFVKEGSLPRDHDGKVFQAFGIDLSKVKVLKEEEPEVIYETTVKPEVKHETKVKDEDTKRKPEPEVKDGTKQEPKVKDETKRKPYPEVKDEIKRKQVPKDDVIIKDQRVKNKANRIKHTKGLHDTIVQTPRGWKYKCGICGQICEKPSALTVHKVRAHGEQPVTAKAVDNTVTIAVNTTKDDNTTMMDDSRRSDIPEKSVMTEEKKSEEIKSRICDTCGQVFSCLRFLERHISRMHVEKSLKCSDCTLTFSLDRFRIAHYKRCHVYFPCNVCGKQFNQSGIHRHMNTHTGNKPFKCKYCGKGFAGGGNRSSHEKMVHQGIKRSKTS